MGHGNTTNLFEISLSRFLAAGNSLGSQDQSKKGCQQSKRVLFSSAKVLRSWESWAHLCLLNLRPQRLPPGTPPPSGNPMFDVSGVTSSPSRFQLMQDMTMRSWLQKGKLQKSGVSTLESALLIYLFSIDFEQKNTTLGHQGVASMPCGVFLHLLMAPANHASSERW